MKNNKDLFSDAIAEAKSIREAAIANAREALEETLTPHLKDMLANKLQEMEDKDVNEMEHEEEETYEEQTDDATLGQEEEGSEGEEEQENGEDSEEEESEEDQDIEDMSLEELKDLISTMISQEMEGTGEDEEGMEGDETGLEDETGLGDESEEELEGDEEINLDELLSELEGLQQEGNYEEDNMEEGEAEDFSGRATDRADSAAAGLDVIIDGLKKLAKKGGEVGRKAHKSLEAWGAAAADATQHRNEGKATNSRAKESKELKEAVQVINKLRKELTEVNVFNAKLLYLNKILKKGNLSENQTVNIIAAFDEVETVKEAKLVYKTVCENTNTTSNRGTKPSKIAERKLSFSSTPTGGNTRKPAILTEQDERVKRNQKLAGIIK